MSFYQLRTTREITLFTSWYIAPQQLPRQFTFAVGLSEQYPSLKLDAPSLTSSIYQPNINALLLIEWQRCRIYLGPNSRDPPRSFSLKLIRAMRNFDSRIYRRSQNLGEAFPRRTYGRMVRAALDESLSIDQPRGRLLPAHCAPEDRKRDGIADFRRSTIQQELSARSARATRPDNGSKCRRTVLVAAQCNARQWQSLPSLDLRHHSVPSFPLAGVRHSTSATTSQSQPEPYEGPMEGTPCEMRIASVARKVLLCDVYTHPPIYALLFKWGFLCGK